jgi:hypothetical protein
VPRARHTLPEEDGARSECFGHDEVRHDANVNPQRSPRAVGDVKVDCCDGCDDNEWNLVTRSQHGSIIRPDLLGD